MDALQKESSLIQLPIRNRTGFDPETSGQYPSLTEPGLTPPLEKILRSQAQGLPVPFMAGAYLGEDHSIIDGFDKFELFEFRQNLELEMESLEEQFHAATKKLAEKHSEVPTDDQNKKSDPNPNPEKIVDPKASKEADTKKP
ncbi:MAG: hypothetical protein [Malazfec virus 7]